MWPYLITYELGNPDVYERALFSILEDLGAFQLTTNTWLITCDWNASAILEQIRPILASEDRLVVLELAEDMAGLNVGNPSAAKKVQRRCERRPDTMVN